MEDVTVPKQVEISSGVPIENKKNEAISTELGNNINYDLIPNEECIEEEVVNKDSGYFVKHNNEKIQMFEMKELNKAIGINNNSSLEGIKKMEENFKVENKKNYNYFFIFCDNLLKEFIYFFFLNYQMILIKIL